MAATTLLTCFIVWWEHSEALHLKSQIGDLVEGKDELLRKIGVYQTDLSEKTKTIAQLERKAQQAAQGITATYYFDGTIRRTYGSEVRRDDRLVPAFNKMVTLQNEKNFVELSQLCEDLIQKNPAWPTPHAFLGVASANLGHTHKAIRAYKHFLANASDEPSYGYGKHRAKTRQLLESLEKRKKDG